jgi:hypothetical protein
MALEVIDGGGGGAAESLVVCIRRLGESPEVILVEEVERVFSANRQCDGGDLGAVSLLILLLSGNLTYVERLVNPVWASWSRRRSLLVELGSLGESPEVALVVDVDGSGPLALFTEHHSALSHTGDAQKHRTGAEHGRKAAVRNMKKQTNKQNIERGSG